MPRIRKAAQIALYDITEAMSMVTKQSVDITDRSYSFGTLEYVKNINSQVLSRSDQNKSVDFKMLIEIADWAMKRLKVDPDEECRYFQIEILRIAAKLVESEEKSVPG